MSSLPPRPPLPPQRASRRTWLLAWGLTLALHALAMLGVQGFRPAAQASPRAAEPEPVQLVFVEPPPAAPEHQSPTFFSELPPDRADEAPERADFLSNVTSRARDQVPGGSDALPRMKGESDAPMVALDPTQSATPPPASPPVPRSAPEPRPAGESNEPRDAKAQEAPKTFSATPLVLRDADGSSAQGSQRSASRPGGSDIHQPEMHRPEGNAALSGDVSLNTIEWEYAPWLQRFGRRLMSSWIAPTAYYIGLLKDGGWTVIEMEVARSGEVLRIDVLEEQGHPSLIRAATAAVRATAPEEPLPANFPEPTLVLRIRMVYPKFRAP